VHCISVTSLYGLSWRRSSSRENRPMNLREEEWSLSCAEGLRKTCVTMCLRTYVVDFNKLLDEMWPHRAHTDAKTFTRKIEQNIWKF
jgi:hypothetical protein